ncbi:hypothetical protein KRP22_005292 [Phytophthora ramorum]|nr:hypothetical protein KRP22_12877 [Phytophthora ramorum]
MQTIHDNVAVLVTQRELQARAARLDGSSAATTALQYVAENSGFDIVTFRVDFSESANIKLHRPADVSTNALQKAAEELAFDCELHPFERRVLAYVVKKAKKRAYVRVHYKVTAVVTPSVDVIVEAQKRVTLTLQRQLQRSSDLFSHVSKWTAIPCLPRSEVERACAEINRYFRDSGEVFVDASFPPTAQSLISLEAADKLSEADSAAYTLCSWEHLHRIADSSWTLLAPPKTRPKTPPNETPTASLTSGLPSQDAFLCALSIISPYCDLWFCRWFPALNAAPEVENMAVVAVALCSEGLTWQHVIIDLFFPSFPLGRGLMAPRDIHGELYATLLHKAYAKLKGSYAAVSRVPTVTILQELTGYHWICLYRCSGEGYVAPSNDQERLRQVVQTTLSSRRQRRELRSPDPNVLVIATFGKIDNHHRAFRLTLLLSDGDSNPSFVVLNDDSARYLREKVAVNLAEFDRDQDPAEPRLSWEQLLVLEPTVWSLSLGRQHEQRLRRTCLHQSDTVEMTAVISVPTLTTVALTCSYLNHFASKTRNTERQQDQVDLSLSVALVEADFSFTPIENSNSEVMSRRGLHQLVRTLSAGEYVVTIQAKRSGLTGSRPPQAEEGEPASGETVLSPATVNENLRLVFDCLDREGKYELSETDIASFLQLQERTLLSQHGKEALRVFMHQHGSSTSLGSEERRLTLDDFREIYLALAVHDCNEAQLNSALSASTASSTSIRARFQELVWQDLLRLLPGSCSGDDSNTRSLIDCQEVVEMVCCFRSDAPLLNVILLKSNNLNM